MSENRGLRMPAMVIAVILAVVLLVTATLTVSARGAPPDRDRVIAFTSDRDSAAGGGFSIYTVAADGRGPMKQLTDTPGNNVMPAWSPEGTELAFVHYDAIGAYDIWRTAADDSGDTALTSDLLLNVTPAWFPGGNKIAFGRGNGDIYTMTLDEGGNPTGVPTRLTTNAATDKQPVVSPDGKKIAFASDRDGDFDIYVMKTARESATNVPIKLTKGSAPDLDPDWAPGGGRIAFSRGNEGAREVLLMRAAPQSRTNRPVNLSSNAADDSEPAWSPDGRSIAFTSDRTGDDDVWRAEVDGTATTNLTDDPTAQDSQPDWRPLP